LNKREVVLGGKKTSFEQKKDNLKLFLNAFSKKNKSKLKFLIQAGNHLYDIFIKKYDSKRVFFEDMLKYQIVNHLENVENFCNDE